MLGIFTELLGSYSVPLDAATELDLFFVPLTVLLAGFGISMLLSCVRRAKTAVIARIEASDAPRIIQVEELGHKHQDHQEEKQVQDADDDAADGEGDGEGEGGLPPDRVLSLTELEEADAPRGRIGASADFDAAGGILLVAGGMADDVVSSDLNIYSVEEKTWALFSGVSARAKDKDRARGGGEAFGFLYGYMAMLSDNVVVFGGIGEDSNPRDTLQIYNFHKLAWELLPVAAGTGAGPSARFNGSTCALGGGRMVIFGGRDGCGRCCNDVWQLQLGTARRGPGLGFTGTWTQLYAARDWAAGTEVEEYVPEPREAHSAAVLGDKLFIFGGSSAEGDLINIDSTCLEVFDLCAGQWSLLEAGGGGPRGAASGGSAHALPGVNKILVVSGEESDLASFNALFVLDVSGLLAGAEGGAGAGEGEGVGSWSLFGTQWRGDPCMPPAPRLFFAAALDPSEGELYMFGGQQLSPDSADTDADAGGDTGAEAGAEAVASVQHGVAVLDLASLMRLEAGLEAGARGPGEERGQGEEQGEEQMGSNGGHDIEAAVSTGGGGGRAQGQEQEQEQQQEEEEEQEDPGEEVHMGRLFAGLDAAGVARHAAAARSESLEEFLLRQDIVDFEFASRFAPAADLAAMKKRLFGGTGAGTGTGTQEQAAAKEQVYVSACPLPKKQRSHT
jgi:hypothetical protein